MKKTQKPVSLGGGATGKFGSNGGNGGYGMKSTLDAGFSKPLGLSSAGKFASTGVTKKK